MDKELLEKQEKLFFTLKELKSAIIAYSGGVDSAFLAFAASKVLKDKVIAVTAVSSTLTEQERLNAQKVAKEIGIKHIELQVEEMEVKEFVANDFERCYYCKKYRLDKLSQWAQDNDYKWVLEGSNFDDIADYRPGMRANEEFFNVKSPLKDSKLKKEEIRFLAKKNNLSVWQKPSLPCLATRICYGIDITKERLKQIEKAEEMIKKYIDSDNVRVRHHGDIARIEVEEKYFMKLIQQQVAKDIDIELKKLGFSFVAIDLAGFRSGSLNKLIDK